jgi:hypothetical protein
MENLNDVFNAVYKKYNAKDYFSIKGCVRNKFSWAKQNNITVKYSDVKKYLLNEKQKAFNMMLKRIEEKKAGIIFPKREKFTWEIFNKLGI